MKLFWNGSDITQYVNILSCAYTDAGGDMPDSVELTLDNAERWYKWGPQTNDTIKVEQLGVDTGDMFLSAFIPLPGQYRVLATGMKQGYAQRKWAGYPDTSIEKLMALMAAECRMEYRLFGAEGKEKIPYALRKYESPGAFLKRLLDSEGARLKVRSGRFSLIDILWAQELEPVRTYRIDQDTPGATHRRNETARYGFLKVNTGSFAAVARDSGAMNPARGLNISNLAPLDVAQAGRYARGLLLTLNREAEMLKLNVSLDAALNAMCRVDVEGDTLAAGEWIADEVRHDLINLTTEALMRRVIRSIA